MKKLLKRVSCVALLAISTYTVLGQSKVDMSDLISEEESEVATSVSQGRRTAQIKNFINMYSQASKGFKLVKQKDAKYARDGKDILVTTLVCADSVGHQTVFYYIDDYNFACGEPPSWEDKYTGETRYGYTDTPKDLYYLVRTAPDTIIYSKMPKKIGKLKLNATDGKLSFNVPIVDGNNLGWEDFLSPSYQKLLDKAASIAAGSQLNIMKDKKDDVDSKTKRLRDNAKYFTFWTRSTGILNFHSPAFDQKINSFCTNVKDGDKWRDYWLESPDKTTAWVFRNYDDYRWTLSNKMLVINQDNGRKDLLPILNTDIVSDMTDNGRSYSVQFQDGSNFKVLKSPLEIFDGVVKRPGFKITLKREHTGEILFTDDKSTVYAEDDRNVHYTAPIAKGSRFVGKLDSKILSYDKGKDCLSQRSAKGSIYNLEEKKSFEYSENAEEWKWLTRNEELAKLEEQKAAENAKQEKVIYQNYCTKYGKVYVDAALKGDIKVGMPAALLLSTFDNSLSSEHSGYKTYTVIPDIPTYKYKEKTITSKGSTHYHTRRLLVGVRNGAVSSVTVLHK